MKKIISLFSACVFSFSLASCSNDVLEVQAPAEQVNALARPIVKNSSTMNAKSINPELARQIVEALDFNKDGSIDVTEVPLSVMSGNAGQNFVNLENHKFSNSYTEYEGTQPLPVKAIVDTLLQDAGMLSFKSGAVSEKNKDKVASVLANLLIKDNTAEANKVYGFSSTVGYFTGKHTYVLIKMDASWLKKKILQQFEIESGSVNGVKKQTANGSVSINRDYLMIDKYKSRLGFSDHSDFDSGKPLFGSETLKDPKVVR